MKSEEKRIRRRLAKVESELEKNRATVLCDGWQTQRFAKKSRKWDMLAIEKFQLFEKLEQLEKMK